MDNFRRFTHRGRAASRCLLWLIFLALLSRALLPGAVMVDPDAPAGSRGLVLCSGHGPLSLDVSDDGPAFVGSASVQARADVEWWLHRLAGDSSHPSSDKRPQSGHGDELCPFGAALTVALVSFFIVVLLFAPRARIRSWIFTATRVPDGLARHGRPPSQAPPAFV